ncbi:DEAD/DEAH box helicase [Sphingobacterium yanglingense]|uniref:Helicase-like protein n=1 Tax=Sphingobacterium yanglingense TaxID=1437280 RepID=A0A4R6WHS2_9SPHI|nr:DEAD/DEAH box helicase [Sphingobacterium yanglingense]TDQ77076.1 helicase-like protein [Sphingobacterium yanglingense]
MKETVETDAVVVSKATALPKRKASEPFLIPWENGEPFKLSKEYLLTFYKGSKKIPDLSCYGSFNDFYSLEEYSFSFKKGDKENFTLYFQVNKKQLSISCNCGYSVVGLCHHAAAIIYNRFAWRSSYYFKGLYSEPLLTLSPKFLAMLNIKIDADWGNVALKLQNSSTYGKVYNLNISEQYDANAWAYSPVSLRGFKLRPEEETKVKFVVVTNGLHEGLPYILPFIEKDNEGRIWSRSYLFHENVSLKLAASDLFKERACKRILGIVEERDGFAQAYEIFAADEKSQRGQNSLRIIEEWRSLIGSLVEGERLIFSSFYGYPSSPSRLKIKNMLKRAAYSVAIADATVKIQVELEDHPSYLRLKFSVWYKGARIEYPQFLSDTYCFFLVVSEGCVVFIDDLDLEGLLREVRQSDYILTVLDRDQKPFLDNELIPIANRYALQVDVKGKKGNTVEQVKKPKRVVDVRMTDSHLIVGMSVEYEGFGSYPLAPQATMLIQMEEGGKRYRYAHRHLTLEQEFYDFIKKQHSTWPMQLHERFFSVDRWRVNYSQWLAQFVDRCKAEGIQVNLDKIPVGTSYYPYRLQWQVSDVQYADNRCSIRLRPRFRGKAIPFAEFEDMVTAGPKVYPLGNNQYGVIQSKDIALFKPLFLSATIEKDLLVLNSLQMISLQTVLEKVDPKIIQDSIKESRERLAKLNEIPERSIPETIQATLRPYQIDGFNWMAFLQEFKWGGILADDMGLGKTLQVITLLEQYYTTYGDTAASLVVVPNSLLFNWQSEYQKFAPSRLLTVYHGPDRFAIETFANNSIVLTTYGTLMSSVAFFEKHDFAYLIMDESQNAKNRNSKRFHSLEKVKALYRIAMTGTPVENGIQDIYAQMTLVNPGFFGNYRAFNKSYKGIADDESRDETLGNLQKMIQPFMLRRTKKQVALDLPDKTETTLLVDMLPAQRKVYDKYRKIYQGEVADNLNSADPSKSKFVAMEALNKLRQICNSPALLKDESFNSDSIKLDQIEEILSEVVPGHKVLLFSFFTSMLQLVEERIKAKEVGYAYLDGKLSQQQRQVAVERFQEDESCRVFLISLKAGGTGLNLTAADYVYILDPWWNPAVEAQAIDRCYRIGQEKHVNAYKIVCKDSVEEKILALQEHKKQLADGLILDETNLMKTLSKEELLKLFD